jgi:hypothetical protein
MKLKLLFLFIFLYTFSFAQSKVSIFGKVTVEGKPSTSSLVELKYDTVIKRAITNDKGYYKFLIIENISNAEIVFKYLGYKSITKKINKIEIINEVNINFIEKEVNQLEEVVIKQEKTKTTANKLIYKVNQKDFIANATALAVFNFVPTLFSSGNPNEDPKVIVDGKLPATIFIDGIESIAGELKNLPITNIDKVEVINNPSAKYGADFTGAIVNIVTRKTNEQYLKGSMSATGYIKNNNWFLSPFLAYKKGILIWKSNYSYLANNNVIDYESNRTDQNGFFNQYSHNNSKGNQENFSNTLKLDISKKSSLVIKNNLYSYHFNASALGYTNNNNSILDYSKNGNNGNRNWYNSIVYDYKITAKKIFYVKGSYNYNSDYNRNFFVYSNNLNNYYDVTSNLYTYSFNLNYEAEEIEFLKKQTSFYTDLKFIQRDFTFSDSNYYLNQKIFDYNAEVDTEWNDKFSSELAITLENLQNYNSDFRKNYNYLLPTVSLLYHFKNKTDLKFGYSRKILRPNASDLNDAVNVINPGVALQGNSNLQSQIRNYCFLNLSKTIKSNYFGLKLYSENINNNIVSVYKADGIYLIQTLDNAAQYNATGFNLSVRTKLFKKLDVNLNQGFFYSKYIDNSQNVIAKSTNGITYIGSITINTRIIKDKIALSLSGNQNGPNYSLLSKRITYPYISFSANTNLIKDKLTAKIFAGNLLGRMASGFDDINSSDTFYQRISARNNSTNIAFGLTYYFGKIFNDLIIDNGIQNNDIR